MKTQTLSKPETWQIEQQQKRTRRTVLAMLITATVALLLALWMGRSSVMQ